MRRYPPEDAHGAGHLPCHYQEIIRTISPLIWLFAANGQLLAQTYEHLDCDIPLNKYQKCMGRRSKRGKVICPGSQHVDRNSQPSVYESCAVPLDHTFPQWYNINFHKITPDLFVCLFVFSFLTVMSPWRQVFDDYLKVLN